MKKRILSLCLSAAIALSMAGFAVNASETAGEGSTTTEAAAVEEEQTQEEVVTDAAGNVITPETAQAIDNADLGATGIAPEESAEAEKKFSYFPTIFFSLFRTFSKKIVYLQSNPKRGWRNGRRASFRS